MRKETIIMKHTVIKLGGSVLRGAGDAQAILDVLDGYKGPLVVVVSALKGVTDRLAVALSSGARRAELVCDLREEYEGFARAFAAPIAAETAALTQIGRLLAGLERLLASGRGSPGGLDAGMDGNERRARVLATGERLSAVCLSLALLSIGRPAPVIEPGRLGLVARRADAEDALADMGASAPRVRAALGARDAAVVPGFYGVGEDGVHRLFGRGGSDYSAAVVAACLGARSCDLIKDVAGLYTADPALVRGARPVAELSYEEAEALAQGGARILHQPCVTLLRAAGVPLRILGCSGSRVRTRVGLGCPRGLPGPRALAIKRGPIACAEITVAGFGCASRSAASVLRAFEASGFQARAFFPAPDMASFRVLVEASRGDEALRVAHEALFGERLAVRGQEPERRSALAEAGGVA
jgi:aspartate kinase/aspartokinase/homoserine dehydrogenase 1